MAPQRVLAVWGEGPTTSKSWAYAALGLLVLLLLVLVATGAVPIFAR